MIERKIETLGSGREPPFLTQHSPKRLAWECKPCLYASMRPQWGGNTDAGVDDSYYDLGEADA